MIRLDGLGLQAGRHEVPRDRAAPLGGNGVRSSAPPRRPRRRTTRVRADASSHELDADDSAGTGVDAHDHAHGELRDRLASTTARLLRRQRERRPALPALPAGGRRGRIEHHRRRRRPAHLPRARASTSRARRQRRAARLVINIAAAAARSSSRHRRRRPFAPRAATRIVSASATGGGGGPINVSDAKSVRERTADGLDHDRRRRVDHAAPTSRSRPTATCSARLSSSNDSGGADLRHRRLGRARDRHGDEHDHDRQRRDAHGDRTICSVVATHRRAAEHLRRSRLQGGLGRRLLRQRRSRRPTSRRRRRRPAT